MQGSAADIIKRAMIAVAAWLKERDDARMLMQVHDELVFEVREDAVDAVRAGVIERMSGAASAGGAAAGRCRRGRQLGRGALSARAGHPVRTPAHRCHVR